MWNLVGIIMKPWILAADGSNPDFPFGFACLRCGAKKALDGSGIPMAEYVKAAKAFRKEHAQCRRNSRIAMIAESPLGTST